MILIVVGGDWKPRCYNLLIKNIKQTDIWGKNYIKKNPKNILFKKKKKKKKKITQ